MNNTELNRIKIRDLFSAIRVRFDRTDELHLLMLKWLHNKEESLLEKATDEDLRKSKDFFIEEKLGIRYYPTENKKVINHKVVPIEQIYGPESA